MARFTPKTDILNLDVGKQSENDFVFEQLLQIDKHRVRIYIKSNYYKAQCVAQAHVWQKDKLEWSPICHLLNEQIKTPAQLSYHPNVDLGVFSSDVDALLKKACLILFGR